MSSPDPAATLRALENAIEGVWRVIERNHQRHSEDEFTDCLAWPCVSWRRIKAALSAAPARETPEQQPDTSNTGTTSPARNQEWP